MAVVAAFKDVTDDMIYEPLHDEEFKVKRLGVEAKASSISEQHAFVIRKVDEDTKRDLLYIMSAMPIFTQFIEKAKSGEAPGKDLVKKVIICITDLIFFVIKTDSNDPLTCEGL